MHDYQISSQVAERTLKRRGPEPFACEASRTALLVIDMQNYFVANGFPLQVPNAQAIVPNINAAATALRAAGGTVIWVQTSATAALQSWRNHHEYGLTKEGAQKRLQGLDESSEGFKLYPALNIDAADVRVHKTQFSALIGGSSKLPEILARLDIDALFIAGTLTNVCCDSTARDAMMLDYRVVMMSDANAALSDAEHTAALDSFQMFFGWVMSTREAMECWPRRN